MSDCPYILQTQDPRELWLVDGEQRMRVSRDMYWLLTSQGADLPPLHDISELLAENAKLRSMRDTWQENDAKLRELVRISIEHCNSGICDECPIQGEYGSCPYADMARELGIEVDA